MQNSVLRAAGRTEETSRGALGPRRVGADRAPAGTRRGPGSPTESPGRGPGEAARSKCVPRGTQMGMDGPGTELGHPEADPPEGVQLPLIDVSFLFPLPSQKGRQ